MAAMLRAIVCHNEQRRRQGGLQQGFNFNLDWTFDAHAPNLGGCAKLARMMTKQNSHSRFHGRVGGTVRPCSHPGCTQAGEFRAPGHEASNFDGPGTWRWFCLEHIREFNAGYNFFSGMDADQIAAHQNPYGGWDRETRAFAHMGADTPPSWANFHDPLDAIGARWRDVKKDAVERTDGKALTPQNLSDLKTLGLEINADRTVLRRRYSDMVRRYHPDRNGGDRTHEQQLQAVIEAYQRLRKAPAFA